jgi:predicted CXXCH cytochrome family protein
MGLVKWIKATLIIGWVAIGILLVVQTTFSKSAEPTAALSTATADDKAEDFVGSETCQACHEKQFNNFSKTAHAKLHKADWSANKQGCEPCHGPGRAHVEGGGDKTKIRTFENLSPKKVSETCLTCHSGKEEHNNYLRGEHWRNDVACTDCHSPHGEVAQPKTESNTFKADSTAFKGEAIAFKMLKKTEPQLCMQCHNEVKAHFTQPFHHKVLEGAMKCSDCHNPHGGFQAKQARLATGVDASCLKCHTDKQGPFVFEHAPLKTEGCTACHTPHGASNPKLLKRSTVNQLCIECHSNIFVLDAPESGGIPNTPSFHNLATTRFQNCTTCHVKIHGSQSHPVFFR